MTRLAAQIAFIRETEKLKAVLRKTRPCGLDRLENTAEHSWQAALTALILLDDAPAHIDRLRVLKMLLIHDIVEIDTGDTFVYDDAARRDVAAEEAQAAERIFGLLPENQARELLDLWHEFEARETPESIFAKAIDRVNPVLQNLYGEQTSWDEHSISRERVLKKNAEIENASEALWIHVEAAINAADFKTAYRGQGGEMVGDDRLELPTSSV